VQTWQQTKATTDPSPAPVRAASGQSDRGHRPHETPILTRSARGGR